MRIYYGDANISTIIENAADYKKCGWPCASSGIIPAIQDSSCGHAAARNSIIDRNTAALQAPDQINPNWGAWNTGVSGYKNADGHARAQE